MPFSFLKKTYVLILLLTILFSYITKAQSDTVATNASDRKGASSLVFRFTKQVYLNPTIILMRQRFEATTHIKLMLLPRLGNDTNNLTRTDKVFDALLKMLVYNQNTTGSVKFYFAPQNANKPFSFECSDEVWCKFNPAQKDSVEKILNAPLANAANLNNFSALPFDSVVTRAAKYCQLVLLRQPGKCGDNPNDNYALKQINTTPAKITFASPPYIANNGNGGVDNKQYNQLAAYYNIVTDVADNSQYNIAWKAVQSQTAERIKVKLKIKQPGFDFSKVVFKNATDPSQVYTTGNISASDSTITLNLGGQSPGTTVEMVAYYTTTAPAATYAIGALNAQVYQQVKNNLVLVNLGNATTIDVNTLTNNLNRIYSQVAAQWNVSVLSNADYNLSAGISTNINVANSGLLSNYMPDMKPIISDFKNKYTGYNSNTYYLFIGATSSDTSLQGYTPLARNIGFVFTPTTNGNFARVIAHELGHGAFHLKHSFDDDELGSGSKSTTNNLMDYNNGETLYKYQWDYIHNPVFVSIFDGDDDDAESVDKTCHYGLTPAGKAFDAFFDGGGTQISGSLVTRFIEKDNFCILSLGYNNVNYKWDGSQNAYISKSGSKISVQPITKPVNDRVNIFRSYGNGCNYSSITVKWTSVDEGQSDIQSAIAAKIDPTVVWVADFFPNVKPGTCGLDNTGNPANCPAKPQDLTTITVDYLVNHFFANAAPSCLTELPLSTRQALIKQMLTNWAVTECFQNIDDPTLKTGNCYEPLVYNLLLSTPITDEKTVLDWLVSENLLAPLLTKTQFQTFDDVAKKLASWQIKYYPLSGDAAVKNALETTLSGIEFEENLVSASVGDGGINLVRSGSGMCSNCTYVPEINITVQPLGYVLVYFKDEVGVFKAGTSARMPALFALYLFNKDRRDFIISSGKIMFDIAMLAVGVGEIQTAYEAYRGARTAYAAYIGIKALADMGMGISDFVISNVLADGWKQTPEGQARLDRWNKINMLYAMGSISASLIDGAIKKYGSNIADEASFDKLADDLEGVVEGAANILIQRKSFWDDWVNKCFPGQNWSNTTFQTIGKDYNSFKSSNTNIDNEMRAMYNTTSAADNFLPSVINSGSTNPIKVTVNQGDKFYKIVPKGGNINGLSPYYVNETEYQWIKANPSQLEQKLGLPLSSVNAEYDVFTITSNANNNILFQSAIAPTKQYANGTPNIVYNTTGGRTQSLIINNDDIDFWIKSKTPIETISPNVLPQIGN